MRGWLNRVRSISKIKLTKSASETVSTTGLPILSITFVPIGAFSSTKPSMFDAVIIGGLLSTGFTVMVNFAVADRFASDTSTAFRPVNKRIILLYVYKYVLYTYYYPLYVTLYTDTRMFNKRYVTTTLTLMIISNFLVTVVSTALICFTAPVFGFISKNSR